MNINQINQAIIAGNFTNDQLNSIGMSIKYARTLLTKTVKSQLLPGVKVKFVSNRTGQTITGTVRKVAIKNIIVDTPFGGYRVPANMIEVA